MITIKKKLFTTIHTDYLRFAILSFLESKNSRSDENNNYVNRPVIESIRYSFDCIDAATQFIFVCAELEQLPIRMPNNWLTRYLKRQWNSLSLSDAIGLLTFSYTGQPFWQNNEQFQLFEDLRKLRNGLTHPKPTGEETVSENQSIVSQELLYPNYLVHSNPIAKFNPTPKTLDSSDAEQALEIMLHHLCRIQDIFYREFNGFSTHFAYYDNEKKEMFSTKRILETLDCKFKEFW